MKTSSKTAFFALAAAASLPLASFAAGGRRWKSRGHGIRDAHARSCGAEGRQGRSYQRRREALRSQSGDESQDASRRGGCGRRDLRERRHGDLHLRDRPSRAVLQCQDCRRIADKRRVLVPSERFLRLTFAAFRHLQFRGDFCYNCTVPMSDLDFDMARNRGFQQWLSSNRATGPRLNGRGQNLAKPQVGARVPRVRNNTGGIPRSRKIPKGFRHDLRSAKAQKGSRYATCVSSSD